MYFESFDYTDHRNSKRIKIMCNKFDLVMFCNLLFSEYEWRLFQSIKNN